MSFPSLILRVVPPVIAFLLPVVALIAPKAMAVLAVIGGVIGLASLLSPSSRPDFGRLVRTPEFLLVLAFLGWAAASWLWSLNGGETLGSLGRLLGMVLAAGALCRGAFVLVRHHPALVAGWLLPFVIGFALALVLVIIEIYWDGVIYYALTGIEPVRLGLPLPYNQGIAALAVLLWPAVAAATAKKGYVVGLLLGSVALAIMVQATSATAVLGSVTGLLCLLCGLVWRRGTAWTLRLVFVLFVGGMALAAQNLPTPGAVIQWLGYESYKDVPVRGPFNSLFPRLIIWDFVGDRIAEKPVTGWGLGSSKHFTGKDDETSVASTGWGTEMERLPLHPHNQYLQWWLELGAVGAFLLGALGWRLLMALGNQSHKLSVPALAACGGAMTMMTVNFSAWHSWWLGSLAIMAGLLLAFCGAASGRSPRND